MNLDRLNHFLKMIAQDYHLSTDEIELIRLRLISDDKEFENIWCFYQKKKGPVKGVDNFKEIINDLLGY